MGFVGGWCVLGSQWAPRVTPWELSHGVGNRELKMASSAQDHREKPGGAKVKVGGTVGASILRTRRRGSSLQQGRAQAGMRV